MILHVHSDASYLSKSEARSCIRGYFYLGCKEEDPANPKPNGPIHIESRIMKNVMASAFEVETGGLFICGQEGTYIRKILKVIGHEQTGPTRIITDNSTAKGFANNRTKVKWSKAMDVCFFWIRDRVKQGEFVITWSRGEGNLADYFTKHHPPAQHIKMRPVYLHTAKHAIAVTVTDCKGVLIPDPQSCMTDDAQTSQACDRVELANEPNDSEWTTVTHKPGCTSRPTAWKQTASRRQVRFSGSHDSQSRTRCKRA